MEPRVRIAALDRVITRWMAEHGITFLRLSVGAVFLWFGSLKFFPGLSPADTLALDTIDVLSFGLIPRDIARVLLAILETGIGLGLITGKFLRITLLALFGQMAGTVTPLFLFPDLTFVDFPFVLTLEGQYIVKNLVLISAGIAIGATVRGGDLHDEPT
jgi:uncharacterized membrane protein YkgB